MKESNIPYNNTLFEKEYNNYVEIKEIKEIRFNSKDNKDNKEISDKNNYLMNNINSTSKLITYLQYFTIFYTLRRGFQEVK